MIEYIIVIGGVYLVYGTLKNIDTMTSSDEDYSFSGMLLNILGLVVGIMASFLYGGTIISDIHQKEARCPTPEYRIETEITTRGDVSDTTYIITRK